MNWFGRVTPHLDGTKVEGAEERMRAVNQMWADRRKREAAKRAGTLVGDVFDTEKIR